LEVDGGQMCKRKPSRINGILRSACFNSEMDPENETVG